MLLAVQLLYSIVLKFIKFHDFGIVFIIFLLSPQGVVRAMRQRVESHLLVNSPANQPGSAPKTILDSNPLVSVSFKSAAVGDCFVLES